MPVLDFLGSFSQARQASARILLSGFQWKLYLTQVCRDRPGVASTPTSFELRRTWLTLTFSPTSSCLSVSPLGLNAVSYCQSGTLKSCCREHGGLLPSV